MICGLLVAYPARFVIPCAASLVRPGYRLFRTLSWRRIHFRTIEKTAKNGRMDSARRSKTTGRLVFTALKLIVKFRRIQGP
jgi:hypothetical protein